MRCATNKGSRAMKALRILAAELKDSFIMALTAIVAHKLRSALTLLGILVGVFSIIIVMTSMRAMQQKIEADLNQLGGQTFVVQTFSQLHFQGGGSDQNYWRRRRINLEQADELARRATLPLSIGVEDNEVANGQIISRYAKSSPSVQLSGETPGSFPAQNWIIAQGRAFLDSDE